MVRVQTEATGTIEAAQPLLKKVQDKLAQHPEIEHEMVTLSAGNGQLTLNLVEPSKRKVTAQQLMATMRKELTGFAGIRASISDPSQQSFGASKGSPVSFTVRGADWDQLVIAATAAPGRSRSGRRRGGLELRLSDRLSRAANHPRSQPGDGARRQRRRHRQHGVRARRRQHRRQVLRGRPPHRHPHASPRGAAHAAGRSLAHPDAHRRVAPSFRSRCSSRSASSPCSRR